MDPITKSWVSLGLVVLALVEFWLAMSVFGKKSPPGPHAKWLVRLHRILGYVFLLYFVWISWICVDLMDRLASAGRPPDARAVLHSFLALSIFGLLLLKLSFIRLFNKYRPQAPMLGIVIALGTLVLWGVAGWMFLIIV